MDDSQPDGKNTQEPVRGDIPEDLPAPPPGMRSAANEPDSLPSDTGGCTVAILMIVLVALILIAIVGYLFLKNVVR